MGNESEVKTLLECVDFYAEDCLARGFSEYTVINIRSNLLNFCHWAFSQGVNSPHKVNLELLEGYRLYIYYYRNPFTQKPLARNTQRKVLTNVKMMMRRLYKRRVINHARCEDFELPGRYKTLPKNILTPDEVERIFMQTSLYGIKGIRDRAVMEVFYATGIRRTELSNLAIQDIDFNSGILIVNCGKGRRDRRIPIAQRACDWVKKYLAESRPKLAGLEALNVLFLTDLGKPYRPRQLTSMVTSYIRRSGINKVGSCNLFRHATATLMLDGGADLRHVQEMLGHANIATTEIYTHVSIKKLVEVYHQTHPAAISAT